MGATHRARPDALNRDEQQVLEKVLFRMNEQAWGIAIGLLLGCGLFLATNVLVIRGGTLIGPHLGLLSFYFPGYRVTFLGSFIGFVYAFVLGYGIGRTISTIYNRMVDSVS